MTIDREIRNAYALIWNEMRKGAINPKYELFGSEPEFIDYTETKTIPSEESVRFIVNTFPALPSEHFCALDRYYHLMPKPWCYDKKGRQIWRMADDKDEAKAEAMEIIAKIRTRCPALFSRWVAVFGSEEEKAIWNCELNKETPLHLLPETKESQLYNAIREVKPKGKYNEKDGYLDDYYSFYHQPEYPDKRLKKIRELIKDESFRSRTDAEIVAKLDKILAA